MKKIPETDHKYQKDDLVLIDKIFSTEDHQEGHMKKLDKRLIARVVEVQFTSLGPTYKLELVDDPQKSLRVCYWEEDILEHFDI